jgi:hypothetical protein
VLWLRRSWQQAQFLAALHGLGSARRAELIEGAGAVGLDRVFGDEELSGNLTIAETAGDEGEGFEFAGGDADALLLGWVGSEGRSRPGALVKSRGENFPRHDRLAPARDAQAQPDAKGGEEDGNEGAIKFDRVLDDDEAVFGVLEGGDEQAADKTENEDVAFHSYADSLTSAA